jgi:hypothetical protein
MPPTTIQEQSQKPKPPIVSDTGQGWFVIANLKEGEGENSIKSFQNNIDNDYPETLKPTLQGSNENGVSNLINIGTGTPKHELRVNIDEPPENRLGNLKMEMEALGSQIDSGKSNVPFVSVGLGALALSGLGVFGYSLLKGTINFFRSGREQREKLKQEQQDVLIGEIIGHGYQTDRFCGQVKRHHARDFKFERFFV